MAILSWFLSPIGSVVAAVVVMLGAWQIDRNLVRSAGVREGVVRVETETKALNAKANAARRAAERDPSGLLGKYCRDCP